MRPETRHHLLTALAVGVALCLQGVWFALDGRTPDDPARLFVDLPRLYWQMDGASPRWLLSGLFLSEDGYEMLLALLLRAHRAPLTLEVVSLGWLALLLVATAGVGRALAGPPGGTAAALLAAGMPPVLLYGRVLWIHYPEAALMMVLLWALCADPRLSRWRTALLLGLGGLVLVRLRPSGLVALGCLGPGLLWLLSSKAPTDRTWTRARLGVVLGLWLLAVLWSMGTLPDYLGDKSSTMYSTPERLGWLAHQLPSSLGPAGGLVVLAGLVAAVLARAHWKELPPPTWLALGLYILAPLSLMLRFHSGAHDFTWLAPSLAVVAGASVVRLHRVGWVVVALPLGLACLAPWADTPLTRAWSARSAPSVPQDLRLVSAHWGRAQVDGLIHATCVEPGWLACRVLAPVGLLDPMPDGDAGQLGLFLLGHDHVLLRALGDAPTEGWDSWPVHALAAWSCPERPDRALPPSVQDLIAAQDLEVAWQTPVGKCSWQWLTPGGVVRAPQCLPASPPAPHHPTGPQHPQDPGVHPPDVRGGPQRPPAEALWKGQPLPGWEPPPGWQPRTHRPTCSTQ